MIQQAIEKLLARHDLTSHEIKQSTEEMFNSASPYQTAVFLALLKSKGETIDELTGVIDALTRRMVPVFVKEPVLDIVGTGGDGHSTLNISTGAAILTAACGMKVAKHGNRSITSRCGAADVLEELGIPLELSPQNVASSIETVGIGFMYAPYYHPTMKAVADIRRGIGMRTIFNLAGPLANPAKASYRMIGVCHRNLLDIFAQALCKMNVKRALVFHGNGLDELTCTGPAEVREVANGRIGTWTLYPQQLGLESTSLTDLKGGSCQENAQRLKIALSGKGEKAFSRTLALNAGTALWLCGLASSIKEGTEIALENIQNGRALQKLDEWVSFTQESRKRRHSHDAD